MMEYKQGTLGRVFYARLDDGDDIHACVSELVEKEGIRCAWFQIFGGMKRGGVVIGPREPVMPPDPVWTEIEGAREVLGMGTVFFDEETPRIHLHAAMGEHGKTLTGCVRRNTQVYLVIELVLVEMTGLDITRPWSEKCGFNMPTFNR